MNDIQHKKLAAGRWGKLSLAEQMANIGSEVYRAISWKNKGNKEYSQLAFHRALELIDLTVKEYRNSYPKLKEILRVREVLIDYFAGENKYNSTDEQWQKYFYAFNYVAQKRRNK